MVLDIPLHPVSKSMSAFALHVGKLESMGQVMVLEVRVPRWRNAT